MSHGAHKLLLAIPVFDTNISHTHGTEGAIGVAFSECDLGFQWLPILGSPGDIQGVIGC